MTKCTSCGRNIKYDNVVGNGGLYCQDCSDMNGNLLPFSDVLENFANHFMNTLGYDIAVSRNAAMEILKRQPAWEPMFKKEEKMRIKKRVLAIIGGLLALVLAVTGVIYGFYRYFRTSPYLFLEKEVKIRKFTNGDLMFNEIKTDKETKIIKVFEGYNYVIFATWYGNSCQEYLYDLNKEKGYCLPSSSQWISHGNGGYTNFSSTPGIDGDQFYWQMYKNQQYVIKMIKLDELFKINDEFIKNSETGEIKDFNSFYEACLDKSVTINSDNYPYKNLVKYNDLFIWEDERNYKNTSMDIYGLNIKTQKKFPICTQLGEQENMILKGDYIFWEDFRDTNVQGYEIYSYNLKNKTEKKIPHVKSEATGYAWNANKYFVCYYGYGSSWVENKTTVYLYNLKTGITEKVADSITNSLDPWFNNDDDSFYFGYFRPVIYISEPDNKNDFVISWQESRGKWVVSKDITSGMLTFKRYSELSKPKKYINGNLTEGSTQKIENISNSGLLWFDYLFGQKREEMSVSLNFFDFETSTNKIIDDNFQGEQSEKLCGLNDEFVVWPPADVSDSSRINLRYMKIR
jgi:hypothetical protein